MAESINNKQSNTLNTTLQHVKTWSSTSHKSYLRSFENNLKTFLISPGHYLASVTQRLRLQWFTWIWR